jgi:FMN reductase
MSPESTGERTGDTRQRRTASIVVVSAGLGQPSATRLLADRIAAAVVRDLEEAGLDARTEVIEVRDHAQDLVAHLLARVAGARLAASIDAIVHADGLVAVSPIFSASYSGLFKMFFDVLDRDSLSGLPVLVAATGGTPRHSLALEHAFRPLFTYLDAAVVPTAVYAAAEDWGTPGDPIDGALVGRIERASRELAVAIASHPPREPVDPFADPVRFEDLLADVALPRRDPAGGA